MDLLIPDRLPSELRHSIATRSLISGQILFRQGDLAPAFYVVKTGRLKIARYTAEQRMVTLQIARPGESFGESALFSEFYFYTVIAEIDSQVVVYPKQTLLLTLRQHFSLAEDFMTLLVQKNRSLIGQLELRDIRTAHRRVLQYLHSLAEPDDPQKVRFDRPLQEMAIDLGFAPATLSRALMRLEREGIIVRAQNSIQIQDSLVA